MQKLSQFGNSFNINRRKLFTPITTFKHSSIEKAIEFSYNMSFGSLGEHRNYRSGGIHRRKNGEIFINTFQGKLAEFAIYNQLHTHFDMQEPDLDTYELGIWDSYDFEINNKKLSVKSTKHYGNLLLLETKDWNDIGEYIPNLNSNNAIYDIFILVRLSPDSENLMKKNRLLYSNECNLDTLKSIILNESWQYDIPGFITRSDLLHIICNSFILPQGSLLNGKTKMDAENYYIQAGDMRDIENLTNLLI